MRVGDIEMASKIGNMSTTGGTWSEASSDAEDIGNIEKLDVFGEVSVMFDSEEKLRTSVPLPPPNRSFED